MKEFIFLVLIFLSAPGKAVESPVMSMLSPKVKDFLDKHQFASQALSNLSSEGLSGRTIQLYYFYSTNESIAPSLHYYPTSSVVCITIRENQQPVDEFICLIFEILNSESEKKFGELSGRAWEGAISRTEFAEEVLRIEFETMKRTQSVVNKLDLRAEEKANSHFYNRVCDCPQEFQDFLSYTEKISSPYRHPLQEYKAKYDLLRKATE